MQLESARSLKLELMGQNLAAEVVTRSALPAAARAVSAAVLETAPISPLALGIARGTRQYSLAVRVQQVMPGMSAVVDRIRRRAKGEIDLKFVGKVASQQPRRQRRNRPLRIGDSVGHVHITAGTLGCFVARRGHPERDFVLSNNHVLANEDRARRGDTIVQPGPVDGGRASRDKIGEFHRAIRLRNRGNKVDAAIASIRAGIEYYYNWLEGLGTLRGVRSNPIDIGERVAKLGRTTGLTRGRVSAIEIDGLVVGFDRGDISFDSQIEIEPIGSAPFSLGGDSGSLIVDGRRRAVALLFAGNDVDSTYANPIDEVLSSLDVDLVT